MRQVLVKCALLITLGVAESPVGAGVSEDAVKSTGIDRGLAVVVGDLDGTPLELARRGSFVVENLRRDWSAVYAQREAFARAGVFPLANAQYVRDFTRLPYAPQLVNLLIIDLDALGSTAPDGAEIRRALVWGGKAYVKRGGKWSVTDKRMPDDVDQWPHALRGPDRIPVSKDKRVSDNIDGMKWAAEHWKSIEQRGSAMLMSDGKHYSIRRHHLGQRHERRDDPSEGRWDTTYTLVARDAQNGLVLWTRPVAWIPSFSSRVMSQNYNGHWATGNNRVYVYTEVGGHLTALSGDTGKVVKVYDQLPKLAAGNTPMPPRTWDWDKDLAKREHPFLSWSGFQGGQTPLAEPVQFSQSAVIVLGDRLVHCFGKNIWVLDEASGNILGQGSVDHQIEQSLVGENGHLYCVGEGYAMSFELPSCKPWWKTFFSKEDALLREVKAMTGPRYGVLALLAYNEGEGSFSKGDVVGIDTATGKLMWRVENQDFNATHLAMHNGVVMTDGWKGGNHYDPKTGEKVGGHDVDFDTGGCSYATYTEQYMIRGLALHSIENPEEILIGDGVRALCQNPIYPAYGQLYSFGTNCGCSVFYRAGLSAFYPAAGVEPMSDAKRWAGSMNARAIAGELKATETKSVLTDDWHRGDGFYIGTKGYTFQAVPASVVQPIRQLSQVAGPKWTRNKQPNWYNDALRKAEADDWVVKSPHSSNIVTASSGDQLKWSLPLGGRLMNHPLIVDGTVYLGSGGGWVHAVELESGEIKWSFQAAPTLRRMITCGQVESAWPVITVQMINGHLVCVAGRRDSFDGGIFVTGLDPLTGKRRWEQNISVPKKRYASVADAKNDGYTGFGRKKSTHAGPLYKGDNENTWWMVGTTPVKIPPKP